MSIHTCSYYCERHECIKAQRDELRQKLEQAEQIVPSDYSNSHQREWVGLTDEEIKEIIGPWGPTPIKGYTRKLFDQIEAKLKEKNHDTR
jgi:hypothetical protein